MTFKGLGSTRITQDTANQVKTVTLNSTTATTILVLYGARSKVILVNMSNKDIWVRPYAASQDNIKHGIFLSKSSSETLEDKIPYIGEYSAIMESGGNNLIYVTEI